ncbi:MAG: S8 family serine peptidase, partial [Clostridium sp.]
EEKEGKSIEEIYKSDLLKEKLRVKQNVLENSSKEMVRFIVEVKEGSDINKVKKALSKINGVEIKNDYKSTIKGFSISAERGHLLDISKTSGVFSVKEAMVFKPAVASAAEMSKAFSVWKDYGYKGEGVVVSIIDSGVDVSHKDMKLTDVSKAKIKDIKQSDETKFTSKVPYGRNFADNNDIVMEKAGITGYHGMHVSGIVAANGEGEDGFKGIAPEAQILAMKVFADKTGLCFEDDLVAAIEDSVKHGADIINMSLGTIDGTTHYGSALQKAIDNAKEQGVLVVIAAGNDSAFGAETDMSNPLHNNLELYDNQMIGYPANVQSALTVASLENDRRLYPIFDLKSTTESSKIVYDNLKGVFEAGKKFNGKSFKLFELPEEEGSEDEKYKDSFILVKYNPYITIEEFSMELNKLPRADIAGLIIYGDIKDRDKHHFTVDFLETFYVSNEDGEKLAIASAENGTIIVGKETVLKDNSQKGKMSSFTSYGPTADLDFKPDVSGVGGHVFSTLNNDKYGVYSGTSMAAPHVAGAQALILQSMTAAKLNLKASEKIDFAKNTTLNTSKVIEDNDNIDGLPYSPRRQGAGFIQIDKAVKNRVIVTDSKRGIGNIT